MLQPAPPSCQRLSSDKERPFYPIFVEEPPERFICSVCTDLFSEPVHVTGCAHIFCRACLEQWLRSNMSCPMCRKSISESASSRSRPFVKACFVMECIEDMRVVCSNGVASLKPPSGRSYAVLNVDCKRDPKLCQCELPLRLMRSHERMCGGSTAQQLMEEISSLKADNAALRSENLDLHKDLDATRIDLTTLRSEFTAFQSSRVALATELGYYKEEGDRAKATLNSATREATRLRARESRLEEQVQHLEEALANMASLQSNAAKRLQSLIKVVSLRSGGLMYDEGEVLRFALAFLYTVLYSETRDLNREELWKQLATFHEVYKRKAGGANYRFDWRLLLAITMRWWGWSELQLKRLGKWWHEVDSGVSSNNSPSSLLAALPLSEESSPNSTGDALSLPPYSQAPSCVPDVELHSNISSLSSHSTPSLSTRSTTTTTANDSQWSNTNESEPTLSSCIQTNL